MTDADTTILKIDLNVPSGANCLVFDYAFYTEEYPEYIGAEYNDAFIAELDSLIWTTNELEIVAPQELRSPSTLPERHRLWRPPATGTTYDVATPRLFAGKPVTAGSHTLYLSIFDQVDPYYDSAVFVDNLRVTEVADVATCKSGTSAPSAAPAPPPPPSEPPHRRPASRSRSRRVAFPLGFTGGVRGRRRQRGR